MKKHWLFTTLIAVAICIICFVMFPTEVEATTAIGNTTAPIDISNSIVTGIQSEINVSDDNRQIPTVVLDGVQLEKNVDYVVWYYNTASIGTAKMLIIGIGDYTGYLEIEYEIIGTYNISIGEDVEISSETPLKIELGDQFDEVEILYDDTILLEFEDEDKAIEFFSKAYRYTTKSGDSDGVADYTIKVYDLETEYGLRWNGSRYVQTVTTRRTLIDYSNIRSIQSPVKSLKWAETAPIMQKDKVFVQASISPNLSYDQELTWKSSNESVATVDDFGVVSVLNPGACIITAYTSNGYSIEQELLISPMDINEVAYVVCSEVSSGDYTFLVTDQYGIMTDGVDYEVSYEIRDNMIFATFRGLGLYSGTAEKCFDITNNLEEHHHFYETTAIKATLTTNGSIFQKCDVCGSVGNITVIPYADVFYLSENVFVCDGSAKNPVPVVYDAVGSLLVKGQDYIVTHPTDSIEAGNYEVIITLIGNYSGTKTLDFEILPAAEIASQPVGKTVKSGATVKFSVAAIGTDLTYQWQSSSNGITWENCSSSSAKAAAFTFTAKTSHSSNYYRCVIIDAGGNVICSDAVRLYVLGVTTQPKSQTVKTGATVKFTVQASGEGLKYQWQSSSNGKTWKNCSSSSAKKATFSFSSKSSHSSNYYRCVITDSNGNKVYTDAVRLYVLGVTTQPKTQKVEAGDKVKFTVTATGAGKTYQWQYSTDGKTWKNCSSSSATSATFSFTSKTSHSGNYYRCRVKDNAGNTVYTDTVRLYVLGITEQPVSKTVTKGKTAKFTVEATGASKTYQWQYSTNGGKTWKNCSSSSATKATFTFTSKTTHNGNYYRCRIKDSGGNTVYTNKVKLTVK